MKRLPVLILSAVVLFSCSSKEKHEESSDWKELDAFHKIMAKAYHPLKDSGNLDPTKQLINQLADEAEKWSNAALPDNMNTPEVKARLQKLKTDSRALANEIHEGASDDQIKDQMIKLHDQFHEIMKAWIHNDGEEGEDEHEHQ